MFSSQDTLRPARLRGLPLAISATFATFAACASLPVYAVEESEDKPSLPGVHVRAHQQQRQRSLHDPRPGQVSTATRTAAELRDIPQSIDSIPVEQAASYGATTLAEVLAGVPGISSNADTRFDSLKIRGFSSVGDIFLDGIRDDAQYVRSLGNIERVEVLKGPAAVLYGRGSGGGVVNRISKQPGADVPSSLKVQAGSFGRIGFAADVNQVLSPQWAMRINAGREHAGSYREGVSSSRQYVAPSLKWSDGATSWLLQAEFAENDRTPDRGMPAGRGADGRYVLPPAAWSTTYGVPGRDYLKDSSTYLRSTIEHRLDPQWKLRHVLGMLHLNSIFDNTYATGLTGPANSNVSRARWQQDMHQRNWQSNLELEGDVHTGSLRHQLLLGAEYSVERRQPTLWSRTPASSVSLINPSRLPDNLPAPALSINNLHRADGIALYAQDQLTLAPGWKLLGGLRWDRFSVDSTNRVATINPSVSPRAATTTAALNPRLGLVWNPVAAHSVYASYSKNFIPSGGADTIALSPGTTSNTNTLPPQSSRQVEVGVKSDWFGDKISTTVALFQLDLYNRRTRVQQAPEIIALTGLERNRGIELGIQGELAPNWFVRSGFSAQRARVLKSSALENASGKRSANVAGANGNLFVSYAPSLGMFGELGLVYESSRYADSANLLDLPAYVRWDGKIGYRLDKAELTLAVTNIGNRRYYSNASSLAQVMPGAPRSFLLSAAYKF